MATNSISRNRATNITGLIDIDALVEANTLRQKQKINTATQKLKVEQYKQEQYREIQKKAKTFYNKYFDILTGGNFLSSSTYNTIQYTESTSNVATATGSSKSNVTNYSISVTELASKASTTFSKDSIVSGNKLSINGTEFILKGSTESEMAQNLNSDLEEAGIKVKAKYSDIANGGLGGLVIENSTEGRIELNVTMNEKKSGSESRAVSTLGNYVTSIDGSALTSGNKIKINGVEYTMNGSNKNEIINDLNTQLSSIGLHVNHDPDTDKVLIANLIPGDNAAYKFKAELISGDKTTELTVDLNKPYYTIMHTSELSEDKGISINNQNFRLKYNNGNIDLDDLNSQLSKVNVEASIDSNTGEMIIKSKSNGVSHKFEAGITTYGSSSDNGTAVAGKNLTATVTEGGNTYTIQDGVGPDGTPIKGNAVTLDGTTFTFTGVGNTTLTGKRDATELTKKIKDFITDYNELLGAINEKLYETRDKSYMPLTDDDKEGLTDSQIEKLEKKAQEGLLRNDSYLRDFAEDMKMTMSTVFTSGVNKGLNLEKIGIKPVNDYTAENGLFTVDEDTLKAAIEEDPDAIAEFFSGENGIITKLKSNLYDHATGTFSRLSNRAGVANGVTAETNEMTKDIEARKKSIKEMEAALKEKEDALYTRYATLESNLSSLQAQQSSLASYFQ